MSQHVPEDLKYLSSHEWVRVRDDGTATVGITHHAQDLLGDMVYVELPAVGRTLNVGQECAVVESVKAASDVYSPVAGDVIEVNASLQDSPELVNKDPYGEGWIMRVRVSGPLSDKLMDADAYQKHITAESH